MNMGPDVKNLQVGKLFITNAKKYPFVSGILLFFFLLLMFLPSVFTFLIFSLALLIFIGVAFRIIFRIHRQNLKEAKGEKRNCGVSAQKPNSVEDGLVIDKEEKSVRRRNVKEKEREDSAREGVEGKRDTGFSTVSNDDLIDKAALVDENPRDIREVVTEFATDRAESSSAASQRSKNECSNGSQGRSNGNNGGGGGLEGESSEDGEDEDEEEAQEDGNKAVEWNEDDQKNLMDLGISEMERNKRLESLIAKRRARKLLSMHVRRTLMNTGNNDPCVQIASILIPRSNPFPPNRPDEPQLSPFPGSAPSVLLPMHNPFDIPYDPQEEKPNLTGGSFEDEFVPAQQKDLVFCRHESFSLGAFFPGPGEFDQSRRETFFCPSFATKQRLSKMHELATLRNQSVKEDPSKLIPTESSQESNPMLQITSSHDHPIQEGQGSDHVLDDLVGIRHEEDRSEVHIEENLVTDVAGGSSSSSSSEVNVPFSAANKEQILKSLSFSIPRNIGVDKEYSAQRTELLSDGSSSSYGKTRPEERLFFADKGVDHTRTHSIASDLQVEVSEVGSPGLTTLDGTISPSYAESLIYDGDVDVEKETTSGSEEMWVASSRLSKVEENESRSIEVHEVSEQDIMEVGFPRVNQKPEDIVPSNTSLEKAVEQDFIDTTVTSPEIELPVTNFDGKAHEVQPSGTSYSSETVAADKVASVTFENAQQSIEKSEAHASPHSNSGKKPQEPSDSPEKSAPGMNTIHDMNDQVVLPNDDDDILEFIKDTYGEATILIERDPEGLAVLTTNNGINIIEITEGNSGVPESDHSGSNESVPRSNLIGNKNIQYTDGEQGVIDIGSSGANRNSSDSIASIVQPEIVAEEGPNDSSTSSSSSVTEEKVQISQFSLPVFYQPTEIDIQEIDADVVDDNFSDRMLPESSNLEVGSLTHLHNDRDPGKPQQGEHQTTMDSDKSVEENYDSKTSVDFEAQLEKLAKDMDMAAPSRPIEKMVDEQVPIALSSTSSPKSDTQRVVSVKQASSSSIDPDMQLKIHDEEIVDINLSCKLLPENSDPPPPQNAEHLSSDSTSYPSYDKDLEELQEKDFIYGANDSEIPANDDMKNSKTTDDNIAATSNPVETNDIEEFTQEREHHIVEVGIAEVASSPDESIGPIIPSDTVENGLLMLNQSLINDLNSPTLLPEVVLQEVPTASSASSSPKSVLQPTFSILSLNQEIHVEVEEPETVMDDNILSSELSPENPTETVPQNAVYLTEDSMAHVSHSGDSGILQEPSDSHTNSTKELGVHHVSNSPSTEKEEKLNSTNQEALIDPTEPSNVGLQQLAGQGIVIGMPKPIQQIEDSGTKIKKLEESIGSKDDGELSMPTSTNENSAATEVVEGNSKNLTSDEANVVGLPKPLEQSDDSNAPVTSEGREKSSVVESEGESQRVMRSVDVAEESKTYEADSSTIKHDEGKPNKPTENSKGENNDLVKDMV